MGKLIAFVGPPGCGKTSVAMQTAIAVYLDTKSNKIAFLSPDLSVPSLGLLFPNYPPESFASLGNLFDRTDISRETLLEAGVPVQSMNNLLCFGFKINDNKSTFPEPIPQKLKDLFEVLKRTMEYAFVDCTDDSSDVISNRAIHDADIIVRVVPADLKGMTWFAANKDLYGSEGRNLCEPRI